MLKKKGNYLTTREAGAILGVTHDHVRKLIRTGKVKAEKLGHNWIIQEKDLQHIGRRRFPRKKEETDHAAC